MLDRVAGLALRRGRLVLAVTAVLFVAVAVLGAGAPERLSSGGFLAPDADSTRARAILAERFDGGAPNLAVLVRAPQGVDDPAVTAAGTLLTQELRRSEGVIPASVVSWWTSGRPPTLAARDGTSALVLARISGDEDVVEDRVAELAPELRERPLPGGADVLVGGEAEVFRQIGTTTEADLTRAEALAFPATAVALVLAFGSAVAALLPLLVGALAILATFTVLTALVAVTDVSVFAVNLAVALGLGLGIDYSLFLVSRWREELGRGAEEAAALSTTLRTAGRTVLVSAVTVALSLSAMLVFPLYFLQSFAYAGLSAVLFAALAALVVLPAMLAVLGPRRVDALDLRPRMRRLAGRDPRPPPRTTDGDGSGAWARLARLVMRRPVAIGGTVTVLLVAAGLPFAASVFGLPDARVLPPGNPAAEAAAVIREDFPTREEQAASVVVPDARGATALEGERYAAALSTVDGAQRVDAPSGVYVDGEQVAPPGPSTVGQTASAQRGRPPAVLFSVIPSIDANGPEGEDFARALRRVPDPYGEVLVAGVSAELVDTKSALADRLPLALALVAGSTLVLLFLFTGSVVLPLKAVLLNLLSLSAVFGLMVVVFQEGYGSDLLGFQATGTLDSTVPILMFCVLFGLSMDYEVFLLSRIREEWLATGDNRRAVALGLQRTGSLITAAAGILALVFIVFTTSGITFIKLLGLGTALAVLVDATLVRAFLVPSFMRLMGERNWWAPRPLRRLHDRVGMTD